MWAPSRRDQDSWLPRKWRRLKVFNDFFASVLKAKCSSDTAQVIEWKGRNWKNEEWTTVGNEKVWDHARNLKVTKSMGSDEMHLWVLRELVGEVAKPLPIVFEKSWQSGEVPTAWNLHFKKGGKQDLGNYMLVSLTLVPSQNMEESPWKLC